MDSIISRRSRSIHDFAQ